MTIITYKEFSNIVPEKTMKVVDEFLKIFSTIDSKDLLTYEENTYQDVFENSFLPAYLFIIYMHLNNDKAQAILSKYNFKISPTMKEIFDTFKPTNKNYDIEKIFNDYSSLFCVCETKEGYYTLTPEKIFVENIEKMYQIINNRTNFLNYFFSDEIAESLDRYNLSQIEDKYKKYVDEADKDIKEEIKQEVFKDLPIETIQYLETVLKVHNKICYNNLSNDFLVSVLLISLYYEKNAKSIVNCLENLGLKKDKLFSNIKELSICGNLDNIHINSEIKDVSFIKYYFEKILSKIEISNLKIEDVLKSLLDRNISGSYLFQKILNNLDIPIEKIQNIDEELKEYKQNEEKIKEADFFKYLHDNYHVSNINYGIYISKIYGILKDKNENLEFKALYSDEDLLGIAILFSVYKYNNKFASFFISKGITLDKCLEYYNLIQEDINVENKEYKIDHLKFVNEIIFKKNACDSTINDYMRYIYAKNTLNNHVKKFMKDININIDINSLETEYKEFIKKQEKEKRIKILEPIYKDLNIDTIKFIELCSRNYKYFKEKLNNYYSEEDIVELTILFSYSGMEDNNQISKYVYDFFNNSFSKHLPTSISYNSNLKNIYDDDIDVSMIKNKLSKYIFGGKNKDKKRNEIEAVDIVNNIFNKELHYSLALEEYLHAYGLDYDIFNCDIRKKYKEYEENKSKKNIISRLSDGVSFEYIDNIDKIYRIIEKSEVLNKNLYERHILSTIIYLFYSENDIVEFMKQRGLTLEKILDFIKIDQKELEEFKELNTDFKHIYNELIGYDICDHNQYSYIRKRFNDESNMEIVKELAGINYHKLRIEVINKEAYVEPPTREEKLEEYKNMPIPKLEINNIENISSFGDILSEQSENIATDFSKFIKEKEEEKFEIVELQNSIREISKKEEKANGFFNGLFRKKENEQIKYDKKEVLSKLDNYLKNKEQSLKDGLLELQSIREAIGIYLEKAKSYLETLNESKNMLNEEIKNKNYVENDFRVFDDNLKMQLLNDKIASINATIVQMLQQYQKITIQMSTHASLINQINISRSTTLQNIYLEMTINEGISKEKDTINSLNGLMGLLDNMTLFNSQNMNENIKSINKINESNQYQEITTNDRILMEQILKEHKKYLIETEDENKDPIASQESHEHVAKILLK